MNEKDKIAMEKLEEYVTKYKIVIDTCSLMDDAADAFWQHIVPFLKATGNKIIIPQKCCLELENHSKRKDDADLAYKAVSAIRAIERYRPYIDIKADKWESKGTFADQTIKTVFTMHRDKYDLLLITKDYNLAKEIIDLNNSVAVRGKKCLAKRINKYGFLSHYDWENPDSSNVDNGTKEANKIMTSVKPFKICTKLSNISATPIRVSCVPSLNDNVFTKNGTIKLTKKIASGGEGTVYETNTQYVAKIYHSGKLTNRKIEKIKRMLKNEIQCEGICFPVSELYNKNKEIVGYLMPKARGKELQRSIFIKPIFLKLFPQWQKKELVQLAITILKKIKYLHDRNILMGDINAGNILVVSPTEVWFVDADSYQIEDLPCPVGIPTFTPPELQGKKYSEFLRTKENENFAVAKLMFMLMLPGKSPYAQKDGEDPIANIKNMNFPYPFEGKSNQKVPEGLWGYIWSHMSYELKKAFYETFQKDEDHSNKEDRLSVDEWIKIFGHYYYELTEGNMIKNDSMSGDLFPTKMKKNPNATYITCKLCRQEVDEKFTKQGICNSCLNLKIGKCKRCGQELDFTNRHKYIYNKPTPELCDKCLEANYTVCPKCNRKILKSESVKGICKVCYQKELIYATTICTACGKKFNITNGEKDYYEKKNLDLPKRCSECRQNGVTAVLKSSSGASNFTTNKNVVQQPKKAQTATNQLPPKKTASTKNNVVVQPTKVVAPKKSNKDKNAAVDLTKYKEKAVQEVQQLSVKSSEKIGKLHPVKQKSVKKFYKLIADQIREAKTHNAVDELVNEAKKFNT